MSDLNRAGRAYARSLIESGKVDKTTAWTFTAQDGDALLGDGGDDWTTYGKNNLGTDPTESFDTKDHWKYPFAKGGTLYRSALTAIRQRASQQKDKAIYDAAGVLLDEIDGTSDRAHENRASAEVDPIVINARPPRIEIQAPRGDIASAPPSDAMLDRWQAGIRAAGEPAENVIQIFDIIGYDFWTGGGITSESVAAQLQQIGNNPVEVQINSPGGDMFEGIAIYEVLRQHKGQVTVKVMGLAASAASVIAMAADKTEISQAGFIMIHNCWVLAAGNRNDFREVADYLEPFDQALRDVYVARTGQKPTDVATWMDNERFINATDALSLGFANSIIDRASITEDKAASDLAKQNNSVRKVESLLTKKGGMTRAQARALIQNLKGSKPGAATLTTGMHDAADGAKRDAGDTEWIANASAWLRDRNI